LLAFRNAEIDYFGPNLIGHDFCRGSLNTATANDIPEDCMRMKLEGNVLMSGVDRLSWLPSGPKVLEAILEWCGFPHIKMIFWNKERHLKETRSIGRKRTDVGRIAIVAARKKNTIARLEILATN